MEETPRTTEQDLLEMAEQFKERMAEKEHEHRGMKVSYLESKKLIAQVYGLTRSLQTECDSSICDAILVEWMISEIRTIFLKPKKTDSMYMDISLFRVQKVGRMDGALLDFLPNFQKKLI